MHDTQHASFERVQALAGLLPVGAITDTDLGISDRPVERGGCKCVNALDSKLLKRLLIKLASITSPASTR